MGRRGQGGRGGGFLKRKGEWGVVAHGRSRTVQPVAGGRVRGDGATLLQRPAVAAACAQPLRVVWKSRRKPMEEEGKEEKGDAAPARGGLGVARIGRTARPRTEPAARIRCSGRDPVAPRCAAPFPRRRRPSFTRGSDGIWLFPSRILELICLRTGIFYFLSILVCTTH